MNPANPSPVRRGHRKRISALRLSSDSTVPTLPEYTSPPWQTPVELPEDAPPEYSDSAEEADADTDSSGDEGHRNIFASNSLSYVPPTPPLTFSPKRHHRRRSSLASRSVSGPYPHRRSQTSPTDPYLDSLLARSVHALELSNALLQSSMSTQTSLSTVLAGDTTTETLLDSHARNISSRLKVSDKLQDSWLDNLDEITRDVEGLLGSNSHDSVNSSVSQSVPNPTTIHERMQKSHLRRPSLDFRRSGPSSTSDSALHYSNHDRKDLVAPPPRALTMYIDHTDDPNAIVLPHTLGLRSASTLPPTPLPTDAVFNIPATPAAASSSSASRSVPNDIISTPSPIASSSRALDLLSNIVRSPSPATTTRKGSRRSSTSSTTTTTTTRPSRKFSISPPPPIFIHRPSSSSNTSSPAGRSRSLTPLRNSSPVRLKQPIAMTPPIEELSASSESSHSDTLHCDKTLESLRNILEKSPHPPPPLLSSRSSSHSNSRTMPRPKLLVPQSVEPVAGTSTATASISRLFTKGRHSSSTRPPSPPRHSSLKQRSTPASPTSANGFGSKGLGDRKGGGGGGTPSPSLSMLSIPDAIVNGLGLGFGTGSSGHSTPKRISFIEPTSSSTSRKSRSSKPSGSTSSKSHSKSKAKGRSKSLNPSSRRSSLENSSDDPGGGWFSTWILGAGLNGRSAGVGTGGLVPDERFGVRPGPVYGGRPGLDDWAI
ncbi:hypothetical protein K474DRAFT_102636 [Panus rudis PR-1116 ss-1]|nr:hypothetical protein K474DRAFT_102636 [Panus rudis PR-1116 ss-1]